MPGTGESRATCVQRRSGAPRVLCARASSCSTRCFTSTNFRRPTARSKPKRFFIVNGGCAANAAVAVARLGGRAALAGPLGGPAGADENGDRVLAALAREAGRLPAACQRVAGLATALSAIFIDARGDRTIVTYRDQRIAAVIAARSGRRSPPPPTSCSPTTAFPYFVRADLRGGAAARHARGARCRQARRWRTIRCFASPRTWSFPPSASSRPTGRR